MSPREGRSAPYVASRAPTERFGQILRREAIARTKGTDVLASEWLAHRHVFNDEEGPAIRAAALL